MANPVQPAELVTFIERFKEHYNFRRAAREIGRTHTTMYRHLQSDADFKRAFEEACGTMSLDALAAAYTRAVEGVEKGIYHQGVKVDTEREYSDSLLALILKATRPEFRDRTQIDVTNPDGSLQANDAQIAARIASILAIAQARKARGEIIDAEIVEPAKLPAPDNSDLL